MIGRLKKVPVSEMYGAGGSNFTVWLQHNLDVLNEAAGMDLSGVQDGETSSPAEILARDPSGGAVVVQNEPGESDDAGLGKLLTSLASIRATTGVWIVAEARPHHFSAVSWINEMSRADLYLLKVEAFRIDDSPPAPMMTLVSGPARAEPVEAPVGEMLPETTLSDVPPPVLPSMETAVGDVSPAEALADGGGVATQAPLTGRDPRGLVRYQFWTELLERASERTRLHAEVEPFRGKTVGTGTGVEGLSYNYFVEEHDAGVELHIDRGEDRRAENELAFNALHSTEDAISYNFGAPLEWRQADGSGARRVRYTIDLGGYADDEAWPELQDRMVEAMIRLEKAMRPHVSRLQL